MMSDLHPVQADQGPKVVCTLAICAQSLAHQGSFSVAGQKLRFPNSFKKIWASWIPPQQSQAHKGPRWNEGDQEAWTSTHIHVEKLTATAKQSMDNTKLANCFHPSTAPITDPWQLALKVLIMHMNDIISVFIYFFLIARSSFTMGHCIKTSDT